MMQSATARGLLRAGFDLGNSQIAHFASATEAGTTAMSGAFCPSPEQSSP